MNHHMADLPVVGLMQRRYDMRHEMLTQRALFCHHANTKPGTLSQHFVTHVVPPLGLMCTCMQTVMVLNFYNILLLA